MADSTSAPEPTTNADPNPTPNLTESDARPTQPDPSSTPLQILSNPTAAPLTSVLTPPPPAIQPSFRPAGQPVPLPSTVAAPQFSPVTYQTPGVPPPGVVVASAVGSGPQPQVPVASIHSVIAPPYALAGHPVRYGPPMPNGYAAIPQPIPQGTMPPVSS